ncbi:MAG: hypothetical protein ACJARX_000280 [Psychroserpens sp.]|jgi:hypothetical protein
MLESSEYLFTISSILHYLALALVTIASVSIFTEKELWEQL